MLLRRNWVVFLEFESLINLSSYVKLDLAIIANILPVYFRNFTAENVAQRSTIELEKKTRYIYSTNLTLLSDTLTKIHIYLFMQVNKYTRFNLIYRKK